MRARLSAELEKIVLSPVLLVATDYDGTIAPIVQDPSKAKPYREALVALRNLAKLPQTSAAVVSGRALEDLSQLLGSPEGIHLVGSHGSEFDPGFASSLSSQQRKLRTQILRDLEAIIKDKKGFFLEQKPGSICLHYRAAKADEAARVIKKTIEGPGGRRGSFIKHGKKVLEISVISTHKGIALERIRHQEGASAVIFFGDDRTDEDAFAKLKGPDISVKVGQGDSIAKHRIGGTKEVAQVLAKIFELRSKWLEGGMSEPIEGHSLLSDQRTFAFVSPSARINWFCAPRVDSGAIFAELLGGPSAGYFSIRPTKDSSKARQAYLRNSLQLVTKWKNIQLTDYLDASGGRTVQRAGRTDLVRVIEGSGEVEIEFAPRMDFGRMATHLKARRDGLEILDSVDPIVLHAKGLRWNIVEEGLHQTARAKVKVQKNKPIILELRYGTGNLLSTVVPESERRKQSFGYWSNWAANLDVPKLPRKVRSLVVRSALTLKGLCYGPTGAIAAAATTSLPEHLGGVRNWDYRFSWLRDAALSAHALVQLGSISEAMAFLDWVLGIVDRIQQPERLRPLYSVSGREVMAEAEIGSLSGYAGSRPVRIGNAAAQQVQLDVFGPIVDLVWELTNHGAPLSADHWRLVEAMVNAVEQRWKEPDHGIWELRTEKRHHTHSKVMCWLTLDRAEKLSERFLAKPNKKWKQLRDRIKTEILKKSWNDRLEAYTSSYGGTELDAATLYLGLSDLLPEKDKKFAQTVRAIEKDLRNGISVLRYRMEDGLPGTEGGFHLCTCWLIESLIRVGRKKDALELFEIYLKSAGPTGLYPEEIHLQTKKGLGNHPQAYSHIGLIQSALRLQQANAF